MEYKPGYQAISLLDNGDFFGDFCILDKLSHFTFSCQKDTMVTFVSCEDLIALITDEFPEELKAACQNARLRLQYYFYQKSRLDLIRNDLSIVEFEMQTHFDQPKPSESKNHIGFDQIFGNILNSERKQDDSGKKTLDLKVSKYREDDLFDFKTDFCKYPRKFPRTGRTLPPIKPKDKKTDQSIFDIPFNGDERIDTEGRLLTDVHFPLKSKNSTKTKPNRVAPKPSTKPISGSSIIIRNFQNQQASGERSPRTSYFEPFASAKERPEELLAAVCGVPRERGCGQERQQFEGHFGQRTREGGAEEDDPWAVWRFW